MHRKAIPQLNLEYPFTQEKNSLQVKQIDKYSHCPKSSTQGACITCTSIMMTEIRKKFIFSNGTWYAQQEHITKVGNRTNTGKRLGDIPACKQVLSHLELEHS